MPGCQCSSRGGVGEERPAIRNGAGLTKQNHGPHAFENSLAGNQTDRLTTAANCIKCAAVASERGTIQKPVRCLAHISPGLLFWLGGGSLLPGPDPFPSWGRRVSSGSAVPRHGGGRPRLGPAGVCAGGGRPPDVPEGRRSGRVQAPRCCGPAASAKVK